jgi:hypothetical protein
MKLILDNLFKGYFFVFPKYALYLIVPTFISVILHYFNLFGITEDTLKIITLIFAPITIFGFIWTLIRNNY